MNIQMQTGGLIILLCLLYFVLRKKTVGLYTEKKEVDVGLKAIQVIFDEKCKGL